ncbi:MAG: class I SAM-dependent methyltransferase [Nitrospiria bacterium]
MIIIKEWFKKQQFNPSFLCILINPHYIARKCLWNSIAKFSTHFNGGVLLDIGCGEKPYKKLFKVEKYYGLEVPVSGHSQQAKHNDIFFDGKICPFQSNSIDYVFCGEVLEHVFEPETFIQEIKRVLKPGGLLLLTVPFVWSEHEQPYDYGRYSSFGIQYLFKKIKFDILGFEKTGNFIQTISQLLASYIFTFFLEFNFFIRILVSSFIIFPILLFGLIFSTLLPKNKDLFLDNVILARKQ